MGVRWGWSKTRGAWGKDRWVGGEGDKGCMRTEERGREIARTRFRVEERGRWEEKSGRGKEIKEKENKK